MGTVWRHNAFSTHIATNQKCQDLLLVCCSMVGQDKLLPGRWVLITGASAGIGKAIALAFSEQGEPSRQLG